MGRTGATGAVVAETATLDEDACEQCGHAFDNHVLVSNGEHEVRGVIFCPVEHCLCESTWAAEGSRPCTDAERDLCRLAWRDVLGHV